MPRRRRNKKVKRYHRSFYSREMKIKKALGILLLAVVVLGAAWLAAPYVLDWATHTWYTVVRDRDLPDSLPAASSEAESAPASSAGSEAASTRGTQVPRNDIVLEQIRRAGFFVAPHQASGEVEDLERNGQLCLWTIVGEEETDLVACRDRTCGEVYQFRLQICHDFEGEGLRGGVV